MPKTLRPAGGAGGVALYVRWHPRAHKAAGRSTSILSRARAKRRREFAAGPDGENRGLREEVGGTRRAGGQSRSRPRRW